MQDERYGHGSGAFRGPTANDNPGSRAGTGGGLEARIDDAVIRLTRLLGRQFARGGDNAANFIEAWLSFRLRCSGFAEVASPTVDGDRPSLGRR